MVYVGEKITTAVVFKNGMILPRKFIWNGRELKINKIALNYSKKFGESLIRFFSVNISGSTSSYELSFNSNNMVWRLEKIEDDYAR